MLLAKVKIGSRIADRDRVGQVIAVSPARITVQFVYTAEGAAACKSQHYWKVYRRTDGRSVGCRQVSWARLAP